MDHRNRARILDVREERRTASPFEFREAGGEYLLTGYASNFNSYDVHGGPALGGWVERMKDTAFDRTLGESPDVMLLINHTGCPLARTKSGTLQLQRDQRGLFVRANLDPSDPDVKALAPKMRRGDMDEMSFAFRVKDQEWSSDYTQREIREVSLHKGDVSVVNFGMNPTTHAELGGIDAVGLLATLSAPQMAELRGMDESMLDLALAHLMEARLGLEPDCGLLTPQFARAAKDPKKPYGDVSYADPGYKDGQKRYPIDSAAHVKAAWSYINMAKNQAGYTSAQVSAIKGRIRSAAKKYGIEISEEKKMFGVQGIEVVRGNHNEVTLYARTGEDTYVPLPSLRASAPGYFNPVTGEMTGGQEVVVTEEDTRQADEEPVEDEPVEDGVVADDPLSVEAKAAELEGLIPADAPSLDQRFDELKSLSG